VPIEEGMVFALETYWPTKDGSSAARIEEEVVVTADGPRIITRFPADQLYVAGTRYWNGFDFGTKPGDRA
jgi:Xaa-Pro aminopeptidase